MIKFTPKLSPVDHDGTVSGQMERLPYLMTNKALEQIAERFTKTYSDSTCQEHPDNPDAEVVFYVPGGNMIVNNNLVYDLHGFCCESFEKEVRHKLVSESPDMEE